MKSALAKCLASCVVFLIATPFLLGQTPPQKPRTNVILLVLDQLRADRLHCYGNPRFTSPNLDQLAERGTRFSRFYSVAPWTAPSYATLMTSLYPSRHGVTLFWRPGMPTIDKDTQVLAEMFKQHGYSTAAFVNNSVAGYDETGRGFDEYFEGQRAAANITERIGLTPDLPNTAPATLPRVLAWLDEHRAKPFFLWVLLWEPHSPNDPPPEHDLFKSDAYPHLSDAGYDIASAPLKRLAMLGDTKAIERLYQLYDGKIHFVDQYAGRLFDHLRELGLDQNTVVVVTSDHGELLYSHPQDYLTFDHRSPYDSVMHIPFITVGPGVPAGRLVKGIASNLDSAPTILELAGLPNLPGAQGKSLVPMIEGEAESLNPFVFGEEDTAIPWRSVRNDRHKLILNLWSGEKRLYDLDRDAAEQADASRENPEPFKLLDARLQDWMRENQPPAEKQRARWRIYRQPERVQIVDDQTVGARLHLNGVGWHSDTALESGNHDGGCFWTESGDGSRSAVWRSDNPMIGTYRVSVFYGRPPAGKLASNASFTIATEGGSETVRVNFNLGAGEWNQLGTFKDPRYVSLSNAADGVILVDAVKFERLD